MSSEHTEQVALFTWANSGHAQDCYPELAYLFAIPNGGQRHPAVGFQLKREGVKSGVLDIMLPVPRPRAIDRFVYCGLFIEMKFGKNWLTKEQDEWVGFLHDQGYAVAICKTAEEAQAVIVDYLEGRMKS